MGIRRYSLALLAILLANAAAHAADASTAGAAPAAGAELPQVELAAPFGGWKVRGLNEDTTHQEAAWPANLIDRGRVRGRSSVRGNIQRREGTRPPADTIVLNGAAMPLFSDANGDFTRPYAFGGGSNGVEIRDGSTGKTIKQVQFFDASPGLAPARLRVVLSWNDHQAEIDMHVITPDGGHAFYADPILDNGAAIDPDGVDGPGPEIFTMAAPLHGLYQVWVNYWGNFGNYGYHFDEETREVPVMNAIVTVITDENTLAEKQQSFVVPLRRIGDTTLVTQFVR